MRLDQLSWTDQRLWPQFEALCTADPSALSLVDCNDRHWSRGELSELSSGFVHRLQSLGIGGGDRLLVAAHPTASTLAAAIAASRLGAVFCPYSPNLGPADLELLEDRLGHAAKLMPMPVEDLMIEARDRESRSLDPRNSDAVLIGFTSGTTGVPKGVMHGPTALNYVTRACAAVAGLVSGEAILGIMPLDSTAGFTFTVHFALSLGHPLVLMGRWNALKAMERAQHYECRWTTSVPTHLITMVEAARAGTWSGPLPFRALAVGGSTMTRDLIADANTLLGLKALRMFGMSECMAHCSNHLEHPLGRRQLFDGVPFPKTEVTVFGADLIAVERGERGEAGVRGPALFLGYAHGLGAGQERMTADGYYLSGDEIIRDREGFIRVIGRFKDQIIRGGFNIDPAEVEAALLCHTAIAEVAVVAVPDLRLGERACAVCRLRLGYPAVDLLTLQDHMASIGISQKKWPEHLVLVDTMRLLPIGKIDKKAMALKAIEQLGLQRGPTS